MYEYICMICGRGSITRHSRGAVNCHVWVEQLLFARHNSHFLCIYVITYTLIYAQSVFCFFFRNVAQYADMQAYY